ncbi:hypothetical protein B9Z55_020609 [Caenorhabditis nigoni]|uniref:Uncharacterized protein n=1 Tax=Caenorhabditis nigoni TaxID=1611254 RepID=A0A2G5TNK1_9PELO|nr:hypothetical protein B9Z55_020609 [Caenorhabditis nigoni]
MPEVVGVELKARDARRAKGILGLREVITTGIENYKTIIVLIVKEKFRSLDIFLAFYDNIPDQLLCTIPPYTTNTHLAMEHGFEKGLKYALIESVEDKDRLKGKTLDWFLNNMQQLNIEELIFQKVSLVDTTKSQSSSSYGWEDTTYLRFVSCRAYTMGWR